MCIRDRYSAGGAGGVGTQSSITGSATYYAGGGGGAGYYTAGSVSGGNGGGGASGGQQSAPTAGTANTGGGGGGRNCWNFAGVGAAGGSGVVFLKIPDANYSGTTSGSPVVDTSSVSGFTILKYTGSGSYTA